MNNLDLLKSILQRKTKVSNSRYLDINLDETAREIGCKVSDVELLLKRLCISKDIKTLVQYGTGNDYHLTVLEKSTIWSDWH